MRNWWNSTQTQIKNGQTLTFHPNNVPSAWEGKQIKLYGSELTK